MPRAVSSAASWMPPAAGGRKRPTAVRILAGHSFGGSFAAIFAALERGCVGGLIQVDAPLAFGEHGGPLARAVATMPPAGEIRRTAGSPVPGSAINALCARAAPEC